MIGETFGNYRIVSLLGSGAMGTVFLGEHERIARRAAIKILAAELTDKGEILRRFFNEARAISLIRHPGIVEVFDCGVHPDGRRPYIAMEYLQGKTLARHIETSGRVSWPEACATAQQIAGGLGAAHCHGIVHRDLKPANVMLVPDAGGPHATLPAVPPAAGVKVLDFGVAKLLHDAQSLARTMPGKLLGTAEYMAPEQCGGEGTVDRRTDVYALGCVLFEMVSGRPPFVGETLSDLLLSHLWRRPPAASAHAQLPSSLDRLIAQMLSKRQEDRPPDMAVVVEALRGVLEGASDGAVVSQPARKAAPRRSIVHGRPASRSLVLAAGFLAIVSATVVVSNWLSGRKAGSGFSSTLPGVAARPSTPASLIVAPLPGAAAPAVSAFTQPPLASEFQQPPPASGFAQPPPVSASLPPVAASRSRPALPPPRVRPASHQRTSVSGRASAGRAPEIDADGIVDL
jgi:serine/threonine protein kinase